MKHLETYKTIKVPLWVYANAKEAELVLLRKGLERLPGEILQPQDCPLCKSELEPFPPDANIADQDLKHDYLRCSHCGYTQPHFGQAGEPSMGEAIGIGLVYLLNKLFSNGGSSAQREMGTGQAS
jgi:DNA-directed RNA polymerase subunit RPC12/RpoP